MAIIELRNVTKKFGRDFKALDDVSLKVEKGEVFGFIGPNGAGKSTAIRVLLGIIKGTEGQAKIFEQDAWEENVQIHERLAYVPGDVNLWPNLTGGEVIDLFLRMRKKKYNPQFKDQLIRDFNLDPSKKCRTYSKGNRQKVALIAAFASEAELFIFDEPTSGLDPLMEATFHKYVLSEKAAGKTVFLSSHILSEVEKLCDRIAIIRQGKILETGTLEELRHLTTSTIKVETAHSLQELENQEGVLKLTLDSTTYKKASFQLEPMYMGDVMNFLATHHILKLESQPATLEDLFMDYYENKEAESL